MTRMVAYVRCTGTEAKMKGTYDGIPDCLAATKAAGNGPSAVSYTHLVGKLERYFKNDAEATVVFSVEKDRNRVELTVRSGGTILRVSEQTSDMFASIDAVSYTHLHKLMEVVQKYGVDTFCAPPTVFRYLVKRKIPNGMFSSVQYAVTAGEALNPEIAVKMCIRDSAGSVTADAAACHDAGIDAYFPIVRGPITLDEAMDPDTARAGLTGAAEEVFRLLRRFGRT